MSRKRHGLMFHDSLVASELDLVEMVLSILLYVRCGGVHEPYMVLSWRAVRRFSLGRCLSNCKVS